MQKHLIIICGPTGIGKTDLSIKVAKYFGSIIISADSRQIYKEMIIGTALPSPEDLQAVKHYFIQTRSIHNYFNASMFEIEVMEVLNDYFNEHDIAIMSGGSGLYIDSVCKGIDDLPQIDKHVREKWSGLYQEHGLKFLQKQVEKIDPVYFKKADHNNPKRLLKAVEVHEMTGKPYSSFLTYKNKQRPFVFHKIGLNTSRERLYSRIDHRVDKMMNAGLLEEAKTLYPFRHLTPLNTLGYKELFDHIDGVISRDEAVEQIKNHSHAYARRQIIWFRRDKSIQWFEPEDVELIINYIEQKVEKK